MPGFDGGGDQFFEVRYQSKDDKDPLFVNVSSTEVLLKDLRPSSLYYAQVRAINSQGRSSALTLPAIAIRTRAENGTDFMNDFEEGMFSPTFFTILIMVTGILLVNILFMQLILHVRNFQVVNVILLCIYNRKKKRRRAEKTEFVRRLNYGNDRRPLQLYGAIGANLNSPAVANRRPNSNNTNKSELLNDQLSEEDDQSMRTMIVSPEQIDQPMLPRIKFTFKQVSPNTIQRQAQPNRFYDGNYIIEDDYDRMFSILV